MRNELIKVICAMSGGKDSGVACFLLKQKGFDVVGVFLDLFDSKEFQRAKISAEKICKKLNIPFLVLDVKKEFKNKIIDRFVKEIKQGTTPNPCVVCNKKIKIDLLVKKLKELKIDFDFIATGHYARLQRYASPHRYAKRCWRAKHCGQARLRQKAQSNEYQLLKAKDRSKDQSYFLWMLGQKELEKILFPLGNYTKKEVGKIAEKIGISRFIERESQDICFIGKDVSDFLKKNIKSKPGKILNQKNEIIGEHQGLCFYTIGQRKSIGLPGGPYFVSGKNIKKNVLFVAKNEKELDKKELIVKNINWISGNKPKLPIRVKAKIRYHHEPAFGILREQDKPKNYKLMFDKPQRAITPGQSVVFHIRENLLGGGIIC
jgi:tRNA-specific 2-thiouridylase